MDKDERSSLIADKARYTFHAIRYLRKMMPQFTRQQKNDLDHAIKDLQDKWWEEIKPFMVKGVNCPPFTKDKIEIFRRSIELFEDDTKEAYHWREEEWASNADISHSRAEKEKV